MEYVYLEKIVQEGVKELKRIADGLEKRNELIEISNNLQRSNHEEWRESNVKFKEEMLDRLTDKMKAVYTEMRNSIRIVVQEEIVKLVNESTEAEGPNK